MKKPIKFLYITFFLFATSYLFVQPVVFGSLEQQLDYVEAGMHVRLATQDTYSLNMDHPYGGLFWPVRIPLIHAYHPSLDKTMRKPASEGAADAAAAAAAPYQVGEIVPEFTFTMKGDGRILAQHLPSAELRKQLASLEITELDFFITIQNNPWKEGTVWLARPQPWLHPGFGAKAPQHQNMEARVSEYLSGGITSPLIHIGQGIASTHSISPQDLTYVFSGGDFPSVGTMSTKDLHILYTVCVLVDDSNKRAALTLHVICTDVAHGLIRKIIEEMFCIAISSKPGDCRPVGAGMEIPKVATVQDFTKRLHDTGNAELDYVAHRVEKFANGCIEFLAS